MTRLEFAPILAVLAAGCRTEFTNETASVWYEELKDVPPERLKLAVRRFINEDGQFPTLPKLQRYAASCAFGELPNAADAVDLILKAVRRFGFYDSERGLASLPTLCRKAVGAVGGWHAVCDSENHETTVAQLRTAYTAIHQREESHRALPESVRPKIADNTPAEKLESKPSGANPAVLKLAHAMEQKGRRLA